MSRRRRRSIRGRKSSSGSKQSVSPFILHKTSKSNSVCCKDELTEKGETDSLTKENVLSASDEEDEKYDDIPSKEKKSKQDNESHCFRDKRIAKPKDKDRAANIVTSVTFDNSKQPFPNITFEQSCASFLEEITDCTVAITTTNIKCNLSNVKFQIQEVPQPNNLGKKTTFVVRCQQGESTNACFHDKSETRLTLKDEHLEQPQNGILTNEKKQQQNLLNYKVTLSKSGEEAQEKTNTIPSWSLNQSTCRKSCCDNDRDFALPDISSPSWPQWTKSSVRSSFSSDALYDIPPPSEFADRQYNTLDGLTEDIASCHIDASRPPCKRQEGFSPTVSNYVADSRYPQCLDGTGSATCSRLFDQLSESDNYEPMFMRPSMSRASYTEDFIHTYAGNNWMRNNSIATVGHSPCSSAAYLGKPTKRRRTFPGVSDGHGSMHEDLSSYNESISSGTISPFVRQSFPCHAERLGIPHRLSPISINSESTLHSSYRPGSRNTNTQLVRQELLGSKYEENPEEMVLRDGRIPERRPGLGHGPVDEMDFVGSWYAVTDQVNTIAREVVQQEVAESGYEEEMLEAEEYFQEPIVEELAQGDLVIQVIPPSRTTSEEYILEDSPKRNIPPEGDVKVIIKQGSHDLPRYRRGSVMTIILGDSDHRCSSTESKSAGGSSHEKHHKDNTVSEAPSVSPILDMEEGESPTTSEVIDEFHPITSRTLSPEISITSIGLMHTEDNQTARSATSSTDQETENQKKAQLDQKDSVEKHSQSSVERKKHLKPPSDSTHKDPDSGPDHWAKRRKLFKESRQWSSAGGSSITSDITEESVSEDNHSMEVPVRDVEDKGFYTETYHSASWIYRGDEPSPTNSAPGLPTPPRPVTIRERTVRICKGVGDYPWGFRIQFSKPIVVTEVDTNGAAEEAGLQVGDYVMAVNGTDVTSVPHSEAADLARQGPDLLTLTIGSDIGRSPNTPRPACRGYLHKRTQSGLIKGWRKRWFVLRHDCCLYYYRHKKDEGRRRALSAVRLEGAEVETDSSLGKPFVFKCCPLSASRVYFFCATSSQEMKRWLEAMGRATHPVTQHHVWVDVTRHNANLPPLAVKNPECLGLLHQIDRNKDMCVQHYCILKDGCLYFYHGIRSTHALGGIYLHGYTVREQTLGSKKSTIELKPPAEEFKTFYLCAEDPTENRRWIVALEASIRKWLPLHQAIQDYMNRPPEETRM